MLLLSLTGCQLETDSPCRQAVKWDGHVTGGMTVGLWLEDRPMVHCEKTMALGGGRVSSALTRCLSSRRVSVTIAGCQGEPTGWKCSSGRPGDGTSRGS